MECEIFSDFYLK